jgi:hypothetical protein
MILLSDMNSEIDGLQAKLSSQLDQLKRVVKVLQDNGVTDSDFNYKPDKYDKPSFPLTTKLDCRADQLNKAMGICAILESAREPKKRWLFRKPPTDELTQGLLDQLKEIYYLIAR